MIIVMPDANTGVRGYFNSIKGDFPYEDFFFQELIPFIEKTYRICTEKRFRAIPGLSMGGAGAIVYALHYPELFAAACSLSAGNGLQDVDSTKQMLKRINPALSEEKIDTWAKQNNGLELVSNLPQSQAKEVRWYIDCGDDDPRSESNAKLHAAMNKKGILQKNPLPYFDLVEQHIWMAGLNGGEFNNKVGIDWNGLSAGDNNRTVQKAGPLYRESKAHWDAMLINSIIHFGTDARAAVMPLITTECWSAVNYKDYPMMNWDWIKELCALGVATASATGQWIAMATSIFAGRCSRACGRISRITSG